MTRIRKDEPIMKSKALNKEGIKKIASGMEKATQKYGLPKKTKIDKKK